MSSSSDDDWEVKKVSRKSSKQSNSLGESNLKGFVSAFNTIIDRKTEPFVEERHIEEVLPKDEKRVKELEIATHDSTPAVGSCEKEIAFKAAAERGVIKLFKAVAMHRKRAMDYEAQKGIGVTKSGQIRRKRPSSTLKELKEPATKTMAGFLDALKKSKSSPKPVS